MDCPLWYRHTIGQSQSAKHWPKRAQASSGTKKCYTACTVEHGLPKGEDQNSLCRPALVKGQRPSRIFGMVVEDRIMNSSGSRNGQIPSIGLCSVSTWTPSALLISKQRRGQS
eukprot:9377420-Karenia_brevis.AAC.1